MSASISTGPEDSPDGPEAGGVSRGDALERALQRIDPVWIAVGLFVLSLAVYVVSNIERADTFDHFVWQAHAFLDGRAAIEWPVTEGPYRNDHFQDVFPLPGTGTGLLPFPPLPAIVLLPFVAVFGLGTNGASVAAVLGAVNVVLCWTMLVSATPRRSAALLATIFYGFGTVAWYAAMLGTTWFLAHVVASTFLFIAITIAVCTDAQRLATARLRSVGSEAERGRRAAGRQLAAGLFFGIAALARLTTIFGAPFFVFVGGGGSWLRRALLAGVTALIPLSLLFAYNVAVTGDVFHPGYQYLYELEGRRSALIEPEWGIEDVRYLPQSTGIMLGQPPRTPLFDRPSCSGEAAPEGLGVLFDARCAILQPDPLGMSLLLTSPAYLLVIPALMWGWRRRIVAGAALAVASIALVDLMHFSQGWVQFGYRFSNDFAPFAVILVALGIVRLGVGFVSVGLVTASILINAWGVYWGVTLGW